MVQNYEEIGVLEGGIFVKKEGKNSELKYLNYSSLFFIDTDY